MIKINNKRILKNSFIISSTLAGFSAIGVGATLFSLHSKETVENTTVYGNLLQAENLFKIYSPYIDVSEQEKTKFNDDFQQAKEGWKSKNKNLKEKLSIADTTLEKILNFYIENIDKINIKDQKNEIFWNEVLKNQLNRIREIDLQKQHKHLKEDARNKFLEILKTTNYEQKQQHLKTLASQISEYVVSQNKILNPFIEILEGASSKLEKVPYEGLKKDLAKSLKPLYLRIISNDIHLNEVQIASQRTSEEILKLDQMLSKIQKEINEIDEYLNLIEPHIENSAYTQLQKQNIESFVEWAKMNLNLALNENDINQIRNTVVTFYHQISDEKRTLEEIKSVLSNLNVYLEELNPLLKNNKNWINNLIVKALEINDKHELISRKASVFSEFYALKFSNQIINQANSEIDLALQNKIIISKKAIMLKSQITSIISKNLWPKEQAKELFDFYNLVNQELHTLGYLNNELMLVEAQINDIKALKFTNNQVQNQLSELKNQVIKTYLNEVSSSYLSSIKDKFNESLRMILKDHLKNLNYLIENKIKMLKKHKTNVNDELIAKFEKIDQNLTEILKDFATVSTSEIVEKIKNNHFKLQNLESAYNQTVAENWSDSADDYLKAVFSSDEENYVPSGGEQSRINLYNEVKEQLKDLRSKINTGDGNPLTAQKVEELTNKLQNLINTANKFRDLSLLQKQVQAFVNTVMQSDNSVILKPYTDNIQAFQIEILELFKNVYATNEQVQGFIEQLNLSFKELKDADTSRLLNEKIEELKDKLYQNYGDNPSTPGAKALNELYNQLLSDSNNFSNNESSKITNKLIDLSNDLFEAENVKEKLLEIIGEKSSAQYSDVKTQKKIQDALEQIQKFDDLIAQLSDSTNIPDPEQFNQIKNSLNGLENEILLAYEQDKIQKINFSIQNYNNQKSTNHNPSYSEAIKKINDYALENSKNLTLEETTKIANKLEKINQLANLSNELLNKYQSSDKNSKSLISEYIANLLNENKLESTDSEEEIEAKIQNLKTAQESIETKKEFLNSYSKINDLLKDKDKKIFEKISGEITSIAQKSNSILNNKNLTEEQLQEEKAKIDVEFELLKRKKEEILHSYNEAITKSDEQFSSLDSDISKLKNLHSNYNFGNYYQKLKETYNAKKTDDNKENLQSYQEKAQIAFYKDLVLNKLKDIETFENTFSSNSNPLYVKIKEQKQKFEGHLKDKIENSNLSLDEVKNLANNADTFFELFNTQKNVVEYINELEKDSSEKAQNATKIQALKDVLEKNQLSSESDYSNPSDKKEILESSYNSNATIELKRSNLNKVLDNNSSGPAGIIQRFEEKLGSSFDTQVKIQLNDYVNSLKKELENSNDTSFASVREKVKKLNDLVVPISEVAKAVGIANDKINSLKNTNSPLISEYKKNLNDLISQTQSNYFKNLDKANNYKDLLNKINESTQKLQKAESLSNKLEEINKITSLNTFNLEFLNNDNLSTNLNNYLNLFSEEAKKDLNNEKLDELSKKMNAFKNVVDSNNLILDLIKDYSSTTSSASKADIDSLKNILTSNIPSANNSQNSLYNLNSLSVEDYQKEAQRVSEAILKAKSEIETKHLYRAKTNRLIKDLLKENSDFLNQGELKETLNTLLKNLITQNNNSSGQNDDLNKYRNQVDIIKNKLESLKDLSQKEHDLSSLEKTIFSEDEKIINALNEAKASIKKAKEYYQNTEKMNLSGEESIENITKEIQQKYYKLKLLSEWQKTRNLYNKDTILEESDKVLIKNKLDNFWDDFSKENQDYQTLFNQYFDDVKNVDSKLNNIAKNSLISYVLENAIKLRKAYKEAQNYISLKDDSLDSLKVKSKFLELEKILNSENDVDKLLTNSSNDEESKVKLLRTINRNISDLVQAKKDQLLEQYNDNNQVKSYIDKNANIFNSSKNNNGYVNNFISNGIKNLKDSITNKDSLSYSEINLSLKNAKKAFEDQIFNLYEKAKNKVQTIKTTILDYFNNFAPTKVEVRSGANINYQKYVPILRFKNLIDNALDIDFNSTKNYITKINLLISVIEQDKDKIIDEFLKKVKEAFKEKINSSQSSSSSGSQPGFYVKFVKKFDELSNSLTGKTINFYQYNEVEKLEIQFNKFKDQVKRLERLYPSIENKQDSYSIANFALLINSLNKDFLKFIENIKETMTDALNKNPLEEIFADLYQNVRYSTSSSYTDELKREFENYKQVFLTQIDKLNADNSIDFSNLNKSSNFDNYLFNFLTQLTSYKDWIKQEENKELLFKQLDEDPKKENPLSPIVNYIDQKFDKKYKVVIAKDEITRKKFSTKFEEFTKLDNNLFEITNNIEFLNMFKEFAFTKKDVVDTDEPKSMFSSVNFKVYIKKYNENGWFENVDSIQEEVDRQSLKAKVVYSYESKNQNIDKIQIERDIVMTFKTLDTIRIPDGNSSIFVNEKGESGYKAKYEVADVDELGWNIPQSNGSNGEQLKNQVINKVYSKMKKAIFNFDESNSEIKNGIQTANVKFLNNVKTNTENMNYINGRLSAYLNGENRSKFNNFEFDFQNQDSISITFNISLMSPKNAEYLRIFRIDEEKGFAFLQLSGGYIIGTPPSGSEAGNFKPQAYDSRIAGDKYYSYGNSQNKKPYEITNDLNPTALNANLYQFNIDYEPQKRKVYFYNSWLENSVYIPNKNQMANKIKALSKDNENNFKTDELDFLNQLSEKYTKNTHYNPEPLELSKLFSIASSINSNIFTNVFTYNGYKLPGSASNAINTFPIWPINGGQQTVWRKDGWKPETAELKPVVSEDFKGNSGTHLFKESAKQPLYAASINKFWFKIR